MLDAFLPELRRCASCHDQCLFGTVEVFARANQSLATSRKALLLLQISQHVVDWTPAAIDVVFSALNSGIQHTMCVHRGDPAGWPDEASYVRAAREDLAARGLAPAWAQALQQNAQTTGDPYGRPDEEPRRGRVILLADAATRRWDQTWRSDWIAITKTLGVDAGWLAQGSSGFELMELGFTDDARAAATALHRLIERADADKVVCDSPETTWMIDQIWPTWGLDLGARVVHTSVWFEAMLHGAADKSRAGQRLAYHDPSALARGLSIVAEPREVLRALGVRLVEFIRSGAEAPPVGSYHGSDVGSWVDRLASDRIASAITLGAEGIVVASPFDLRNLTSTRIPTYTLQQVVADRLHRRQARHRRAGLRTSPNGSD
jgi:Fe-S oxidoreductase